jgi:hypothetical protein
MPLKKGYTRPVIESNIRTLYHEGRSPGQSVAISLKVARASYRAKHPRGALPSYLKEKR